MKISFGITTKNMVFLQFSSSGQQTDWRTDLILPPEEAATMALELASVSKQAKEREVAQAAITRPRVVASR